MAVVMGAWLSSACGAGAERADSVPPETQTEASNPAVSAFAAVGTSDFDGSWVVTAGVVGGRPVELLVGREITLSVEDAQVRGVAACNEFGATLQFDGQLVSVSDAFINEAGCEPAEVHLLEDLFFESFVTTSTWQLDGGRLMIANDTDSWSFERPRPVEVDVSRIVGVTWVVESVQVGDNLVAIPESVEATLLLGANNVYRAETGCGYVDGSWGTNGGFIGFGSDSRSLGDCSGERAEFDQLLVTTLSGRVEAEDDGTRLVIRSLRTTLILVRDPEGPSSLPPLPASSVSPVRMVGGEPAGQVIGPVMIARQCDPDCAHGKASITGTLALIGDCLYVDNAVSGPFAALWPFGTQWQPDPPAVVLPGGATIAVGDQFDGGGSFHTVADLGAFTDQQEVLDRASACTLEQTAEIAVIQTS